MRFARAIAGTRANAAEGVAVVEVLEAMQRSLEQGGAPVTLEGVRA